MLSLASLRPSAAFLIRALGAGRCFVLPNVCFIIGVCSMTANNCRVAVFVVVFLVLVDVTCADAGLFGRQGRRRCCRSRCAAAQSCCPPGHSTRTGRWYNLVITNGTETEHSDIPGFTGKQIHLRWKYYYSDGTPHRQHDWGTCWLQPGESTGRGDLPDLNVHCRSGERISIEIRFGRPQHIGNADYIFSLQVDDAAVERVLHKSVLNDGRRVKIYWTNSNGQSSHTIGTIDGVHWHP